MCRGSRKEGGGLSEVTSDWSYQREGGPGSSQCLEMGLGDMDGSQAQPQGGPPGRTRMASIS